MAEKRIQLDFPADHEAGMRVPKGGSSCATCKFLRPGLHCAEPGFQKWNGSNKIPTKDADAYCSDWYEPKPAALKKTAGDMMKEQKAGKG